MIYQKLKSTNGVPLSIFEGSCDFEHGLCTWTNSKGDDFDWIQKTGSTGTTGTGPSSDHTLHNAEGTAAQYCYPVLFLGGRDSVVEYALDYESGGPGLSLGGDATGEYRCVLWLGTSL